mmetsp:Transcript_52947/g.118785  ORF Transcript_52947/g.118785 Transcript_52947/m.118785 type:complete len:215 (-) Transcript_52947:1811-2455(-)
MNRLCSGLWSPISPPPLYTTLKVCQVQPLGIWLAALCGLAATLPSGSISKNRLNFGLCKAIKPAPMSTTANFSQVQSSKEASKSRCALPAMSPLSIIFSQRLNAGLYRATMEPGFSSGGGTAGITVPTSCFPKSRRDAMALSLLLEDTHGIAPRTIVNWSTMFSNGIRFSGDSKGPKLIFIASSKTLSSKSPWISKFTIPGFLKLKSWWKSVPD